MAADLQFAEGLIACAMTKHSWSRNSSWVSKFQAYVALHCPSLANARGMKVATASDRIALAFLASVMRENPKARTRVDSAKRAVNFLRAIIEALPLDGNPNIRLFARSARNAIAHTVRQSPAFQPSYVQAIVMHWGSSPVWWKRMVALMILLAICTVARGAEIVSTRRDGLAWVRNDGTQIRQEGFCPLTEFDSRHDLMAAVKGFLLLFPSRKNKSSTPSWIPVISATVISLLARHIRWIDARRPGSGGCLFPARASRRNQGSRVYDPALDRPMGVDAFRMLIRMALVEACGLTQAQAAEYGTHSLRVGAIELLRRKGVSAELRQQLGGWMSASCALGYLQLPVSAQFNVLRRVFY